MHVVVTQTILCPKCKGRKKVIDKEMAIFTCGLAAIFGAINDDFKIPCPTCKGKGKITL